MGLEEGNLRQTGREGCCGSPGSLRAVCVLSTSYEPGAVVGTVKETGKMIGGDIWLKTVAVSKHREFKRKVKGL